MRILLFLFFGTFLLSSNSVNLFHGWNMIGSSTNESNLSKTFQGYQNIQYIWKYNNLSKNWEIFLNNLDAETTYPKFNSIKQKDAIWILNSGDEVQIQFLGSSQSDDTSIFQGWNFVGVDLEKITISKVFKEINEITKAWSFNNEKKEWLQFGQKDFTNYQDFDTLNQNDAFWIFNNSAKVITTDFTSNNKITVTENRDIKVDGDYLLLAWNDLGMHCLDDNYSIFSILPPYNNLRTTLIKKGREPHLNNPEIDVTYQSAINLDGTTNTESASKTDFWDNAKKLFNADLEKNQGLTGNFTPSNTPRKIENSSNGLMEVKGIPLTPYNDDGSKNYYQLIDVVAKNSNGQVVASTKAVLPVSDEMNCKKCHQSNSKWQKAKPSSGWENSTNITEDYKLNILKLHDDEHFISGYVKQLKNYNYKNSLYETAKSGTPILCASCHKSNALGTKGFDTIPQLTTAIHKVHSTVSDENGQLLNDSTNKNSCYSCHPGSDTDCLRGAMSETGNISCQNCHGKMSNVAKHSRIGWVSEPSCQGCHQNGKRTNSIFTDKSFTTLRDIVDTKFATNLKSNGDFALYKDSFGHGDLSCQACHGSQHSIYPSLKAEDNLQSQAIQGHNGTISNCVACHKSVPKTSNHGPHGMHSTSQWWVEEHEDIVEHNSNALENCKKCHGSDLRGSELSETFQDRKFDAEKFGTKTYKRGTKVSCFDCHNGVKKEDEDDD